MIRRREFLLAAAAAVLPTGRASAAQAAKRMRIGVIGSGRIGGTLGALWAKAGHELLTETAKLWSLVSQ